MHTLFRCTPPPIVFAVFVLCLAHDVRASEEKDADVAAVDAETVAPLDAAPDEASFLAPAEEQAQEAADASSVDVDRLPFRLAGAALAVVGATVGVLAFVAVSVAVVTVFGFASGVLPQASIFAELRPLAVVLLPLYMGAGAGLFVAAVAKPMNALATGAIVAGSTGVATIAGGLLGAATLGALLGSQGVGQPSSPYFGDPIIFGLLIGGFIGAFVGATTGAGIGSLGSTVVMGALVGDRPSWWDDAIPATAAE